MRLLLPAAFEETGRCGVARVYPLHCGGGEYTDWTDETDVEAVTASSGLLVADARRGVVEYGLLGASGRP